MARSRKRYDESGRPVECRVSLPASLSVYLYRERLRGKYRDETDLVAAIIRKWAEGQEDVDWPALLKELRREEKESG